MKTVALKATQRDGVGKEAAKKIRKENRIPAVVYGTGVKATPISVAKDDFFSTVHTKAGENVVIQLGVTGEKNFEQTVLIKEVQLDPVTDRVDHIDFHAILLTEKIKVKVPLRTKGDAIGVKEGGILDVVHHEIEVACLPTEIPERFDIDITKMAIGHALHVRELVLPEGVVPVLPEGEVIVAVHAPKAEEVATEETVTEPEVIGKADKEEGDGEAGTEEPAKGAAPAAEKKDKKDK
jgi:large subunit ribosomal protein L25